ncbi:uncharacterized protein LOC120427314, partial [Culex pipiens pallens]|uniref:uncharacterized protein LOC120427314 n=2 Tax=Culex pipiens pallens TaxID=42434 RepID=UPI0022AB3E4F
FCFFSSKRGKGIEQLIGGHFLYHDFQKNSRNKFKNNYRKLVLQTSNANSSRTSPTDRGISLETASTGNGKIDQKNNSNTNKEESKKTLSDQVNEGKYGLIHTELFKTPIIRPGVLSYKTNYEVPKDDANNYGGLKDDEIWLSEDHLLVLNGGSVNKINEKEKWQPIDDYVAPQRQVKLPENPKIPPPFPVQLADDAPIQFIGNNKLPIYNPFTNQTVFLFSNERVPDIQTGDFVKKNTTAWNGEKNPPSKFNGYQYPPPAPLPIGEPNKTFSNPFLNLPALPPLPTGSIDEKNSTDIDEEDNSLYYPPPYSFEYESNYTNPVSPGPLVPGIILPPPPNFFAPLMEMKISMSTPTNSKKNVINSSINERTKNMTFSKKNSAPINTTQTNVLKYNIEIEKVVVKSFPSNNDTKLIKSVQPTQPRHFPKIQNKTKTPAIQLQTDNFVETPPLISLNQQNVKGNPIYFEYFDARTSSVSSGNEYSFTTTTKPLTSTTPKHVYGTTTAFTPIIIQVSSKRPPNRTYIPSKQKESSRIIPNIENLRYKTMHEFNKEIENIRHTLRLYKNSAPPVDNYRKSKARPNYEYPFGISPTRVPPQIQTSYINSQYSDQFHPDVKYQPYNAGLTYHSTPIGVSHHDRLPTYDKPDSYDNNFNRYRNPSLNVEITSANPHLDLTFQTAKPSTQLNPWPQPNWFRVEKVKVLDIPKPLISNNGASGYNTKIFLQNKYSIPSYSAPSKPIQVSTSYRQSDTKKYDKYLQLQTQDLAKDTLVNYKHPLPAINFDSELLPYNGRISKPLIDYKLSGDQASVYYITPHEFKYQ